MPRASRTAIIAGFAAIYLIWGSTYLAIRLGVATIPPFLLAGIRFLVGGSALYAWTHLRGAPRPKASHWMYAAILGTLMAGIGNGLVTYAEQTVPSGLAALMVALIPVWIVLMEWLRPDGTRPRSTVIIGLVLGLTGYVLLINPAEIGGWNEVSGWGALMLTLASLSWASGSLYSRRAPSPASQVQAVSMQMLAGGAVLMVLAVITGEFTSLNVDAVSWRSLVSLTYLAVFGSTAYAVYVWLLKVSEPSKVATYAFVNPVIALALGSILAGEPFSPWTLFCSIVIITSVALIVTSRASRAKKEAIIQPGQAPRPGHPAVGAAATCEPE